MALCNGASLCVVPHKIYISPSDLIKLCDRLKVTVLSQTPAAFAALEHKDRVLGNRFAKARQKQGLAVSTRGDHPYLRSVRSVVFAGDKLDFSGLCKWFERHDDSDTRLYNCYGITETSVFSTCRRITAANAIAATQNDYPFQSLIGKPMAHNDFVVLNSDGKVVPHGVLGELYIGGLAVTKGYLRREELTGERFFAAFGSSEKVYFKTGDLVKYTSTGEFDFLGRADQQLKVRGF